MLGDGTSGFHIAELETALRRRLPFVAIVGNDARWNAESQIQLREYGQQRTTFSPSPAKREREGPSPSGLGG